jgi:hypothetical protein
MPFFALSCRRYMADLSDGLEGLASHYRDLHPLTTFACFVLNHSLPLRSLSYSSACRQFLRFLHHERFSPCPRASGVNTRSAFEARFLRRTLLWAARKSKRAGSSLQV